MQLLYKIRVLYKSKKRIIFIANLYIGMYNYEQCSKNDRHTREVVKIV